MPRTSEHGFGLQNAFIHRPPEPHWTGPDLLYPEMHSHVLQNSPKLVPMHVSPDPSTMFPPNAKNGALHVGSQAPTVQTPSEQESSPLLVVVSEQL